MSDEDWQEAWQPVIALIGTDLSDGKTIYGADRVEASTIRRYLEPLEFDCALHTDPEVAQAHGFADVTAPYTAATTYSLPPVWRPGEQVFTEAERNAQPARGSVRPLLPPGAPTIGGFFAAESAVEFLRPVVVGDRLGRRGYRLVGCTPKETRVGRGAFVTIEIDIVDEAGEPVARAQSTLFMYTPRPGDST